MDLAKDVSSIFNSKNDHHFFPKDVLRAYLNSDKIDQIYNICLLTFGENNSIRNKPPWVYLKEYRRNREFRSILSSHAIPFDKSVLERGDISEKFESFKEKRCELVKKDLEKYIGKKYVVD